MSVEQADLINKKYKELQSTYSELEQEHLILKQINETLSDTVVKQLGRIRSLNDTISKYKDLSDSIHTNKLHVNGQYTSLQDSLWKWALGPTLIYTQWPEDSTVYLMDLSEYYMATDDFGIIMVKMSTKEYTKYLNFKQLYGLPESAFWQFRTDMNIKRLKKPSTADRKVWKYKKQWNKPVTP